MNKNNISSKQLPFINTKAKRQQNCEIFNWALFSSLPPTTPQTSEARNQKMHTEPRVMVQVKAVLRCRLSAVLDETLVIRS